MEEHHPEDANRDMVILLPMQYVGLLIFSNMSN